MEDESGGGDGEISLQKLRAAHHAQLRSDAHAANRLRARPFAKVQGAGTLVEAADGTFRSTAAGAATRLARARGSKPKS